jgi:hypothetical protein
MAGETDLAKLLSSMSPVLMPDEYVFLTFSGAQYGDYKELEPIVSILESEGLTLVVSKEKADTQCFEYEGIYRKLTLEVHSSLEAVGLTAAFATKLTENGISANVVAGFFHDHIFVQRDEAQRAINALRELSVK